MSERWLHRKFQLLSSQKHQFNNHTRMKIASQEFWNPGERLQNHSDAQKQEEKY